MMEIKDKWCNFHTPHLRVDNPNRLVLPPSEAVGFRATGSPFEGNHSMAMTKVPIKEEDP